MCRDFIIILHFNAAFAKSRTPLAKSFVPLRSMMRVVLILERSISVGRGRLPSGMHSGCVLLTGIMICAILLISHGENSRHNENEQSVEY